MNFVKYVTSEIARIEGWLKNVEYVAPSNGWVEYMIHIGVGLMTTTRWSTKCSQHSVIEGVKEALDREYGYKKTYYKC